MSDRPPSPSSLSADADRIAALERYAILDTPPEPSFDDIVLIAKELCATPIALVSLVASDRQWFKARVGLDACETPIEQSVCAYALEQPDDILVVPDMTRDPRTRENPLVTGSDAMRFYAGVPLVTGDRLVLGTLCVIDRTARPGGLSMAQSAGLRALARQIMRLFELRRSVASRDIGLATQFRESETLRSSAAALAESEMRLRLAIEATGVGIWDFDPTHRRLHWDGPTRAMFGIGPSDPVSYEESFLAGLHPEDRQRADAAVRAALDPNGPRTFSSEYRTIAHDGTVLCWLSARGRLAVENGIAKRLVGTVRDITVERQAELAIQATEERYRLVTRATNDVIWDWDLAKDHVLWNESLLTAYGWDPSLINSSGGWWIDHIHPDDRARVDADIHEVIAGSGIDWSHEYRFECADGSFADVLDRGSVVRDAHGKPVRMIGAMLDLTERNRAEAQFRAVFEGANVGIIQLDPRSLRALRVNAKLRAIWGADEADIVGQPIGKWTPDEDAQERELLHRRLTNGEIVRETLEKRYRRKDGGLIWARVNIVSQWRGEDMLTTAMIEDITSEKQSEARHRALIGLGDLLREAKDTREVATAAASSLGHSLGVSRAGYAEIDCKAGLLSIEVDWTDEGVASLTGSHSLAQFSATIALLKRGRVIAVQDASLDPRLAKDAGSYAAIATRAQVQIPLIRHGELVGVLFVHDEKIRDWTQGDLDFAREVAERTWATLARVQAEDLQRLLNRELSHRMKNTLAMVQAITSQTLRKAVDIEAARDALLARLFALGKAHDLLLSGETESAEIRDVIANALAIHDDGLPGRFRLTGPSLLAGPKAALALALMMHELGTNAAKYGALSVPDGKVDVEWSIDKVPADPMVRLIWSERNGPPVTAPTISGFGSRLIERGLAGAVDGEVVIDYDRAGVVCRVIAPLSGFLAHS